MSTIDMTTVTNIKKTKQVARIMYNNKVLWKWKAPTYTVKRNNNWTNWNNNDPTTYTKPFRVYANNGVDPFILNNKIYMLAAEENDGNTFDTIMQLDEETNIWSSASRSWINVSTNIQRRLIAGCFWTDGTNIYYDNPGYPYDHYIVTSTYIQPQVGSGYYRYTFTSHSWSGLNDSNIDGRNIFSDGTYFYTIYDKYTYKLGANDTWSVVPGSYNGQVIYGNNIWSDGRDIYYAFSHKWNKSTNTWDSVTFTYTGQIVAEPVFENKNIYSYQGVNYFYYTYSNQYEYEIVDTTNMTITPTNNIVEERPDWTFDWERGSILLTQLCRTKKEYN